MKQISVFVVDDEIEFVREMIELLRSEGALASGSDSASLTLSHIQNFKAYDIFIVDYLMPDMDGASFIKKVRELGQDWVNKRFILCSGYSNRSLYIDGWKSGVFEVIEKPVFHSDLIPTVFNNNRVEPVVMMTDSEHGNQKIQELIQHKFTMKPLNDGYVFLRWAADIDLYARLHALDDYGCTSTITVDDAEYVLERSHILIIQKLFNIFEKYAAKNKAKCRFSIHAAKPPDDCIIELISMFVDDRLGENYYQEVYDLLSSNFDLQYFDETDCKLFLKMSEETSGVQFAVQLSGRTNAASIVCLIPPNTNMTGP